MSYVTHLVRHTAVYGVALVFGRFLGFFLIPIYTRYLSPADYGVLELLEFLNQVLSGLLGANLASALVYFSAQRDQEEGRRTVFQTTLLAAHGLGLVSGILLWFLSPWISSLLFGDPGYTRFCRVAALGFAFIFPQEAGLAYLRANNESNTYAGLLLLKQIATAAANVCMIAFLGWGAISFLFSSAVSTAIVAFYLDARIFRLRPVRFDLPLIPALIRYSAPMGWSALGMTLIHSGNRFFLQRSAGLAQVGIYGLGHKLGTLAGYIQPSFETYWSAQMFHVTKGIGGDRRYVRTLTYFMFVSMAAAVAVALFTQPVTLLATPSQFHEARLFAPLIAISYCLRGGGDYFRNAFALRNRTSLNVVVTGAGLLLAFLSYSTLIPWLKAWGAAIATLVIFIGMSLVSYVISQRVHRYHFEWARLAKITVCGLLCIGISPFMDALPIWTQFTLAGVGTLAFPALLWAVRFFEREEVDALQDLARQLKARLRMR